MIAHILKSSVEALVEAESYWGGWGVCREGVASGNACGLILEFVRYCKNISCIYFNLCFFNEKTEKC